MLVWNCVPFCGWPGHMKIFRFPHSNSVFVHIRRPFSDSSHVTAPYQLSFFIFFYYYTSNAVACYDTSCVQPTKKTEDFIPPQKNTPQRHIFEARSASVFYGLWRTMQLMRAIGTTSSNSHSTAYTDNDLQRPMHSRSRRLGSRSHFISTTHTFISPMSTTQSSVH